jgi:hypothetical protein|tara:strand:- start:42 stop:533 length:492 start_codon:yes stop_codon:yes gene_type:complete
MSWINILKNMGPNLSRLKNYTDKVERMIPSLKKLPNDIYIEPSYQIIPKDIPESVAEKALEMLDKLTFNKRQPRQYEHVAELPYSVYTKETDYTGERIRIDVSWTADTTEFGRTTMVEMSLFISTSYDVFCDIRVGVLLPKRFEEISDEEYSKYADIVNWRDA